MAIYKAEQDMEGKWYVNGPGLPDFYGGYLYPESRFDVKAEADKCANLCGMAANASYKQAQSDIRAALGVKRQG